MRVKKVGFQKLWHPVRPGTTTPTLSQGAGSRYTIHDTRYTIHDTRYTIHDTRWSRSPKPYATNHWCGPAAVTRFRDVLAIPALVAHWSRPGKPSGRRRSAACRVAISASAVVPSLSVPAATCHDVPALAPVYGLWRRTGGAARQRRHRVCTLGGAAAVTVTPPM